MTVGRILRIGAAVAILISGIVHLDLYFNQQYRFAGDVPNFGRSLILNAISSGVIAVALVARKEWFVKVAGLGFAASTIAVFAYTHGGNTFLGFNHNGPVFDPSPQAQVALIVQIAAIVMIAATFVPAIDEKDAPLGLPAIGVAGAVAAVALIGMTVRWKPEDTKTVSTPPPTTEVVTATTVAGEPTTTAAAGTAPAGANAVSIKDFVFDAKDLSVAKGTSITWTNNDKAAHSVVAGDKSFKSDKLAQGATFEYTFDTPGTFPYVCGIHNYMTGTITVTG